MRGVRLFAFAVVLVAFASSAGAEDPPPAKAKHVNVVTPEAKAAMEKYARLVYRPTEHGLRSMSGAIFGVGFGGSKPRRFTFQAGGHVDVEVAAGVDPSSGRAKMGQFILGAPLEASLAGLVLVETDQYDAQFVDREGRETLVVTNYKDGAPARTGAFTFDANGLVATAEMGPESSIPGHVEMSWAKSGDSYRLEVIDVSASPLAAGGSLRVRYELTYSTLAGTDVVTSFGFAASGVDGKQVIDLRGTFRLDDVVVNGAKVDVPMPPVHEQHVSPEARRAIDTYLRRTYLPSAHGLRSLSGAVFPAGDRQAQPVNFAFVAPGEVVLTPPAGMDPRSQDGVLVLSTHRVALDMALKSMELASTLEFDAEFVDRGGCRLLEIAGYSKGVRTETRELDFDGNGLLASVTVRFGEDPTKTTGVTNVRLTWEKTGALHRIARVDTVTVQGERSVRTTTEVRYSQREGIDLPSEFSLTWTVNGERTTRSYVLANLVLNGKPVAAPPAPADKK